MVQGTLFNTRRDWIFFSVLVVVLVGLFPFVLVSYELAYLAVLMGLGGVVALGIMELAARLIGNRKLTGTLLFLAMLICVVLLLVLPNEWEFAENLEERPYTGRDYASLYLLIQGAFCGLVGGLGTFLRRSPSPEEVRERDRAQMRGLMIAGGAVVGLFGLLFTLYVLGMYVLLPSLRYFL